MIEDCREKEESESESLVCATRSGRRRKTIPTEEDEKSLADMEKVSGGGGGALYERDGTLHNLSASSTADISHLPQKMYSFLSASAVMKLSELSERKGHC
jgi:hypothetical protein